MRRLYFFCLTLTLLSFTHGSPANTIYQYQDKDGIKRFSDMLPETDQPVTSSNAYITEAPAKNVWIEKSKRDGKIWLTIFNRMYSPVEVEMTFNELKNMASTPILPKRFVVQGRSELAAVSLHTVDSNLPSRYRYRYRYMIGPPNAHHQPRSNYIIPFPKGRSFKVVQAFGGSFSHNTAYAHYAVDISMPVGTPIVCARDGIVVAVEHDFVWGGADKDYYGKRINYIRILHNDGTLAYYGHLKRGSSRVQCGDRTSAGDVIAESGNTGYSTGPHLHFVIQKNDNLRKISVPFLFRGPNGEGITPVKGQLLHR